MATSISCASSSGSSQQEPTQINSQPAESAPTIVPDHCWAILTPLVPGLAPIELRNDQPEFYIGRDAKCQSRFDEPRISYKHVKLKWDGVSDNSSVVTIKDTSSNGTYVNGDRIQRGITHKLSDRAELALSLRPPGSANASAEEQQYRYLFHLRAAREFPKTGIYAHYAFGSELGRGTYATVHKAIDKKTGQIVAIKMIKKQPGEEKAVHRLDELNKENSKEFVGRATKEANLLGAIDHPNVYRVHSVFSESVQRPGSKYLCYIVMDFVDGGTLHERIGDGFDELATKQISWQILQATSYFHSLGIAHRDLKAENILLTSRYPPLVKVADFGLAKLATMESYLKTRCGTPVYVAPEIFHKELRDSPDDEAYSCKVDCFSVGVIIHLMLTATYPFPLQSTQQSIDHYTQTRTPNWEHLMVKRCTSEARDLIYNLLRERPSDRASAEFALNHGWFLDYDPPQEHKIPEDYWSDERKASRPKAEVYFFDDENQAPSNLDGQSLGGALERQISDLSVGTVDTDGMQDDRATEEPESPSRQLFKLPSVPEQRSRSPNPNPADERPVRRRQNQLRAAATERMNISGSSENLHAGVGERPIRTGTKRGRDTEEEGELPEEKRRRRLSGRDVNAMTDSL